MNLNQKECAHAYAQISDKKTGRLFCPDCHVFFYRVPTIKADTPLILPPVHYDLTETTWEQRRPWKNIPFKIAKKYHWYISIMGVDDYLVMPVYWKRKPVFYSARRLTDNGGLKYNSPSRHKYPWVSGPVDKVVFIGEGIADAAYISQIAPSVALLGSYYLDEIGLLLKKNTKVIIILDNDPKGIIASSNLKRELQKQGWINVYQVFLQGKNERDLIDPTDLSILELRKQIKKQTRILLK